MADNPLTPELLAEFSASLQQLAALSQIVDRRWAEFDTALAQSMIALKERRDSLVKALDATGKIIIRIDEIAGQVGAAFNKMTPSEVDDNGDTGRA